ncbi:MAG: FmdB family zinc ribbon protein [Thermoanaerobaculia bacterium]
MPLYEYECTECGHRTELLQRHGDPPLDRCRECGGTVRKLFSAPAVQFKGTGWYVTDYAGKGKKPDAAKASGGDKEAKKPAGGESTESKKSAAKSSGSKE